MPTPPLLRRRAWLTVMGLCILALVIGVTAVIRAAGHDTSSASTSRMSESTAPTIAPVATATGSRPTGSRPTGSRPANSTASVPVAVPAPARAGVTFGTALYALTSRELARALDDVVRLHMRWIRIDLSWAAIQPLSASRYDWRAVDAVVSAARKRSLRVLGLVTYTPPWARAAGCNRFSCPPRRTSEFAAFAATVVRRYASQGVRTYEVWNEPNITNFWRNPDPRAYGSLLRATTSAIRAASSDAVQVHFGSLAFVSNTAARVGNIDAARFLRQACAARNCRVDAVGYDPYTYPRLPGDTGAPLNAWQRIVNPAAGAAGLRAAMTAVGLGTRTVWVTAFGAPSTYRGGTDRRLVSEARQAAILRDGARLAGAAPRVIGAYFVNTLRDDPSAGPLGGHFGLVRRDGSRKPAFAALAAALKS